MHKIHLFKLNKLSNNVTILNLLGLGEPKIKFNCPRSMTCFIPLSFAFPLFEMKN